MTATPSWDADAVSLYFWFIRHDADDGRPWDDLRTKWLDLVKPSGRFNSVDGDVVRLEDMTAAEHVGSDQLNLDHLSTSD